MCVLQVHPCVRAAGNPGAPAEADRAGGGNYLGKAVSSGSTLFAVPGPLLHTRLARYETPEAACVYAVNVEHFQ